MFNRQMAKLKNPNSSTPRQNALNFDSSNETLEYRGLFEISFI